MFIGIFFNIIYNSKLKFKVSGGDSYICSKDDSTLYGCSEADKITIANLEFENGGKTFINVQKYNKIFDIAGNKTLMTYSKHGGPNQVFEIKKVNENDFMLVNREKCVSYDMKTGDFNFSECDKGESVYFNVIFDIPHTEKEVVIVEKTAPLDVINCTHCHLPKHRKRHYTPMEY